MKFSTSTPLHLGWLVLSLSLSATLSAQTEYPIEISGPPQAVVGNVFNAAISPDGNYIVYAADQEAARFYDLYSVPADGGTPTRLSSASSGSVPQFKISPDSTRVIYRSDQDTDDLLELFSVPIAGGTVTKLNPPLPSNRDVTGFRISPEGGEVVYLADQDIDEVYEIFRVAAGGGPVTRINTPLPAGREVQDFEFSPNGNRVVYLADQIDDDVGELFSVPVTGGGVTKLNPSPVTGGNVNAFQFSFDGATVVYQADLVTDEVFQLFAVPVGGGASLTLTPGLAPDGDAIGFQVSPTEARVVYMADQDTDNVTEAYVVPLEGGPSTKLSALAAPDDDVQAVKISHDGIYVVYLSGPGIYGRGLYSVPTDGGDPVQLNDPATQLILPADYLISPENDAVYYKDFNWGAEEEVDHLFAAPIDGGTVTRITPDLVPGGDVDFMQGVSPEGGFLLYAADQDIRDVRELYRLALPEGAAEKVNAPLAIEGLVRQATLTPDGTRAVYLADSAPVGSESVYSTPVEGGPIIQLSPPGDWAGTFAMTPDGGTVVYVARQSGPDNTGLFRVPVTGGTAVMLHPPLAATANVADFAISPDGGRVVYRADADNDEVEELYSVPLAGGTPFKLNAPLVPGGKVWEFEIDADSTRVAYRAEQDTVGRWELYSVPINGGDVVKISPETLTNGVSTFHFHPDGDLVYFLAALDDPSTRELYRVASSGGSVAKVSPPLTPGGNIDAFTISPDGRHLVYVADQDTDQVRDLYSIPAFGGSSTKLNTVPAAAGGIYQEMFRISPDSSRVLFLANDIPSTSGHEELFSVPITGGIVTRLNPDLGTQFDSILDFQFSTGGSRVVYRTREALATLGWTEDLHIVPVTGGASRPISASLPVPHRVLDFFCESAGTHVLFRVDPGYGSTALYAWKPQAWWAGDGGEWTDAANWSLALPPDAQVPAIVNVPAVVSVPGGSTPVVAESLYLGGGGASTILELDDGAVISLPGGATFAPGAVLRGDGVFSLGSQPMVLPAGAELRTAAGEQLTILSGAVGNAGVVEASGRAFGPAELHFAGALTNTASTGFITLNDAILRVDQGLSNHGWVAAANGLVEVRGPIDNHTGGVITVSGGATVIFWDDVANGSIINASASGGLQSRAIFFGALSGNGISGGGHVFIEGDARPGFSPGTMGFGGDLSLGALARLDFEIAGAAYDRLSVAGRLDLGGTVDLAFIDGTTPGAGMRYDLWDAGSVTGQFTSVNFPPLPAGLYWHDDELNTSGEVAIGLTPPSFADFAAVHDLAAPWSNPDGDGLCNLLEYLAGTHPRMADAGAGLLAHRRSGSGSELSFLVTDPGGADLTLTLETSPDLGALRWPVLASRTGNLPWSAVVPVEVGTATDGRRRITITHPSTGDHGRFYRLRVQLRP